ncbi:MAG: cation:dicarboxylase symporter family transporter, partial [Verrucomicrobiota bacterium]
MKDLRLVFIPAGLGILAGLFFGGYCAILRPFGSAYVMLLQAAVYPYVIASLMHGLGSLRPEQSFKLFCKGWWVYLFAWVLTFGALLLVSLGIPAADSPVANADAQGVDVTKVLELVIPRDIITAIAQNYVPAVIVFCTFYGIALQHIKDKGPMLSILDALRHMSLKFWKWIVKLVPYAVFALVADTAGSTAFGHLAHLGFFLVLLFGVSFILAFWMLPEVVAALSPLSFRGVLRDLREGVVIALATTISATALPAITEATRKVAQQVGVSKEEADEVIGTNLSITYVIGQLGNFFVLLFILFAIYYFQRPEDLGNLILLPFMTLLSAVGSPTATVDSVAFLSSWLGLPDDAPALFVELLVIVRYGMLMASVTGFGFLSILVTLSYFGKLKVQPAKLVRAILLPSLAILALALGTRWVQNEWIGRERTAYMDFTLLPAITQDVRVTVHDSPRSGRPAHPLNENSPHPVLKRIQSTGELWVGYNDGIIPFCYRNQAGELVGFDVEAAYSLANSLNVDLVLVPFNWESLEGDLTAGRFDIAMAGIYVTSERLRQLEVSSPYYNSPVALFGLREKIGAFTSRDTIDRMSPLRLGVFDDPVLRPLVTRLFPSADIVIVPSYAQLPDFGQIEAAVWTLEQATALASAQPKVQAIAPDDLGSNLLFAYLMPPGGQEWRQYVNYWIDIRTRSGEATEATNYWLEGQARRDKQPRWSILRNVLGWVD